MKAKALKLVAKRLRNNQTKHERLFAGRLSALGINYRCQAIIGPWIADFYLPLHELVVEIDGSSHFKKCGILRDKFRDAWFEQNNYRIVHVANEDVENCDLDDLLGGMDKNGPVVEEEGLPAYLTEFVESF